MKQRSPLKFYWTAIMAPMLVLSAQAWLSPDLSPARTLLTTGVGLVCFLIYTGEIINETLRDKLNAFENTEVEALWDHLIWTPKEEEEESDEP